MKTYKRGRHLRKLYRAMDRAHYEDKPMIAIKIMNELIKDTRKDEKE